MSHRIVKILFAVILALFSCHSFALSQITNIKPGISLYSEYYPNPVSAFKGTIIFFNGSGTDITEWTSNQQFLQCSKNIGSLFFYDRSGLGKSPPDFSLSPQHPLTAQLVSDNFSLLLKQQKLNPPYLIVAHSYGAMYAGYFILQHSKLIKGVVLVDPVPSDFTFSDKLMNQFAQGVSDAKKMPAKEIYKKYDASDIEVFYQLLGFNQSKQSIKALGHINNNIPVIIISSTGMEKEQPLKEDWYKTQQQWLNKNPHSKIVQVTSDHFIQLRQPQIVCDEIKQLVNS